MKYFAIRIAVALCTFAIGLASATVQNFFGYDRAARAQAERDILCVEREYIDAHINRDTATLDNILADGFTIRSRFGVTDKSDRLALLANPDFSFESIETRDVRVHVMGDHAIVDGLAVLRAHNRERCFTSPTYRFARDYEKRDGRWQIAAVRIMREMWD